jgi:hypothetical protein
MSAAEAGRRISTLAILCDIPLLLLMLVGAPCFPCLLTAGLIALTYFAFTRFRPLRHAVLAGVWGILFIMDIGTLISGAVSPWALQPADEPLARVYFSPSCGACLKLILDTPHKEAQRTDWCPVAKNDRDIEAVALMKQAVKKGIPLREAVIRASEYTADPDAPTPDITIPEMLRLRAQLWINRAHVLHGGQYLLPYRQTYGFTRSGPSRGSRLSDTTLPLATSFPPEMCNGSATPCD